MKVLSREALGAGCDTARRTKKAKGPKRSGHPSSSGVKQTGPRRRVRQLLMKLAHRAARKVGLLHSDGGNGTLPAAATNPPGGRSSIEQHSPQDARGEDPPEELADRCDYRSPADVVDSLELKKPGMWSPASLADAELHFDVLRPSLRRANTPPQVLFARPTEDVSAEPAGQDRNRAKLVQWIVRQHQDYELSFNTLYLAVHLLDRLLTPHIQRSPQGKRLGCGLLCGAVALLAASKFEDNYPPDFSGLADASQGSFVLDDLFDAENAAFQLLDYRLHCTTAAHHLGWLQRLNDKSGPREVCRAPHHRDLIHYLAELGLSSEELPRWAPSHHACAAVVLSNQLLGHPAWPPLLEKAAMAVSGEAARALRSEVSDIAHELARVLQGTKPGHASFDKFSGEEFGGAAEWAAATASAVFSSG